MPGNVKNLEDLKTVAQLKTELAKLNRENKAAFKTIDKLIKDTKKKDEEIAHLKDMLEKNVPLLVEEKKPQKVVQVELSPEEEIAELQLEKLRQASRQRKLTLEETRQYDLLVKNKRLSQEQSTINLDSSQYKNLSEAELIKIAGAVDEPSKKSKS